MTGLILGAVGSHDVLSTPITEQSPAGAQLEAMRLHLSVEQEELKRQKDKFAARRLKRLQELHDHTLQQRVRSPEEEESSSSSSVWNLVVVTIAANAIEILEGVPGHEKLHQIRV